MAKKGESDEKVQAGTGPETLGKNVPGEPDEREAAALVAGGDPGAVEGEGAELPSGEPADAAGESAGVVSDDGAATAPVVPAENPGAGETDGQGADQAAAGASPGGATNVEGGGDLAAGATAAVIGEEPIEHTDPALAIAVGGYHAVLYAAHRLGEIDENRKAPLMGEDSWAKIGLFVRKIGKRATADVIGQQLKILGHTASAEISPAERVALGAFAHLLVELDAFGAAEAARIEAEKNRPAPPPKLPVEETTLEPVDDHFDTWR